MRGYEFGMRCSRLAMGVLAAALTGTGCSLATSEVPRPGECPALELTAITPPDGSVGVPTNSAFSYTFSDFPEPDTANSDNFGILGANSEEVTPQ